MPRRTFALVLVMYLGLDLMTPWIPGIFSFDDDDLFVATVFEGEIRPVRLLGEISRPRVMVVAPAGDTVLPGTIPRGSVNADGRARGRPRMLPSERSSLPPSSLEDH